MFYPRSTFDLVMAGKRSNFREIGTFSNLQADIRITMKDSDMKPSLTCSPCNSALDAMSFKPLARIFSAHNAKKSRAVTLLTSYLGQIGDVTFWFYFHAQVN